MTTNMIPTNDHWVGHAIVTGDLPPETARSTSPCASGFPVRTSSSVASTTTKSLLPPARRSPTVPTIISCATRSRSRRRVNRGRCQRRRRPWFSASGARCRAVGHGSRREITSIRLPGAISSLGGEDSSTNISLRDDAVVRELRKLPDPAAIQ